MTHASLSLGLLITVSLCAPTPGRASATPAQSAAIPTFGNARLGMSLQAWRALPFPGPANRRVVVACSGDRGAKAPRGPAPGAVEKAPGEEVCAYVARYGPHTVLTQSFEWGKGVLAHAPEYHFVGGRLSRIDFEASIDAFDSIMARLKARYGGPARTLRGDARTSLGPRPKVEEVWDTPSAVIDLTDPTPDPTLLSLSLAARTSSAAGPAAGAAGGT